MTKIIVLIVFSNLITLFAQAQYSPDYVRNNFIEDARDTLVGVGVIILDWNQGRTDSYKMLCEFVHYKAKIQGQEQSTSLPQSYFIQIQGENGYEWREVAPANVLFYKVNELAYSKLAAPPVAQDSIKQD